MSINKVTQKDLVWIQNIFQDEWGDTFVVSRGKIHEPESLEGYYYREDNKKLGLITFNHEGEQIEIVTLNSWKECVGIGTSLINTVIQEAEKREVKRIWLITTNDNLNALGFYQKRGFLICAVHLNAIDSSRKLKPSIPLTGEHGIPIRDEIELEMLLK